MASLIKELGPLEKAGFINFWLEFLMDHIAEVTWHPTVSAGSLQSLIILLSQHLSDKRTGRKHLGYSER